jgi:prephenate dehydrogenase
VTVGTGAAGEERRVAVIGTGLIGGSLGLALRKTGRTVVGYDRDPARLARAVERGAVDRAAASVAEAVAGCEAAFVAVPAAHIPPLVCEALDAGAPVVSDVGSVKRPVVTAVEAFRPATAHRFIGGHPMAGSEQEGVDGADDAMFAHATWVLTPTPRTRPEDYTRLRALVGELGAEVLAVDADAHDELVAVVSHVPHLAAGTLMRLASARAVEHATLLRLAAGGFRDMTRIAAGNPGIWPDICASNRDAIVETLDAFITSLAQVRDVVARGDRQALSSILTEAMVARRALPASAAHAGALAEVRVPIEDRPGMLGDVTTLAGERGVNILDLEIAHSVEGGPGILVLVVPEAGAAVLEEALAVRGYRPARRAVE